MKNMKKMIPAVVAVLVSLSFLSVAQAKNARRHPGPPPEAFAACEGKSAGERSQFVDPEGQTVAGTCEERNGRMVLRPDHPKHGEGRRPGPPPAAYTACEGKSAGERSQFVNRQGDTMTGTCEKEGDRLVLRPDPPK